jgi:hypothetical protein
MALSPISKIALLNRASVDKRLHPETQAKAKRTANNLRALLRKSKKARSD